MEVKVTNQESLIEWHCQRYSTSGQIERRVFENLVSDKFKNNRKKALLFIAEDFRNVMVERFGVKVKSLETLLEMFELSGTTIEPIEEQVVVEPTVELGKQKERRIMVKPVKKVLEYLQTENRPLLASEIETGLNLKKVYARQILSRLVELDLIIVEQAKKYRPEAYRTAKAYSIKPN